MVHHAIGCRRRESDIVRLGVAAMVSIMALVGWRGALAQEAPEALVAAAKKEGVNAERAKIPGRTSGILRAPRELRDRFGVVWTLDIAPTP